MSYDSTKTKYLFFKNNLDQYHDININSKDVFGSLNNKLDEILVWNTNKERVSYSYNNTTISKKTKVFQHEIVDKSDIDSINDLIKNNLHSQNPNGNADCCETLEKIKLITYRQDIDFKDDSEIKKKIYLCSQSTQYMYSTLAKFKDKALHKGKDGTIIPFEITDNTTIVIGSYFEEIIEVIEYIKDDKKEYNVLFYHPKNIGKICKLIKIPTIITRKEGFIEKIKQSPILKKYINIDEFEKITIKNNTQRLNDLIILPEEKLLNAVNHIQKNPELKEYKDYVNNEQITFKGNSKRDNEFLNKIFQLSTNILDNPYSS